MITMPGNLQKPYLGNSPRQKDEADIDKIAMIMGHGELEKFHRRNYTRSKSKTG